MFAQVRVLVVLLICIVVLQYGVCTYVCICVYVELYFGGPKSKDIMLTIAL